MIRQKVSVSWSGGKDSALALWYLVNDDRYEVVGLHTTLGEQTRRVGMHGVHEKLIEAQAAALGLRLDKIYYPASGDNNAYEKAMGDYFDLLHEQGVRHIGYGDILLQDLKDYREKKLAEKGFAGVFPLWERDTKEVAREFIQLGFHTKICAGEADKVEKEWIGRLYGLKFLHHLSPDVDPCGEYGEFHTFCLRGPIFTYPLTILCEDVISKSYEISLENGAIEKKHYWFADLALISP